MHSLVNTEEETGKTVGRRRIKDSLSYALDLHTSSQDMVGDRAPRFTKGVFRFRTFEEADAWTMKFLTAPRG